MEQRLRLVQGGSTSSDKRTAERRNLAVPGQIVWKDGRGTTRLASVVTRDVSEHGVAVECLNGAAIPLYRLVYFQIDRDARHRPDLPEALRKPNVLSAVFRVGPYSQTTGAPSRIRAPPPRRARSPGRQQAEVEPATWVRRRQDPHGLTDWCLLSRGLRTRRAQSPVPSSRPPQRDLCCDTYHAKRGTGCARSNGCVTRSPRPVPNWSSASAAPGLQSVAQLQTRFSMIDRRGFVQSMIALGAVAGLRPVTAVFGAMADQDLKDLADAALATARKAGASYADIRINRYRNQFIFTRDRARPEHRQHRRLRLRRPRAGRRHLGLREQQHGDARTKSRRSRGKPWTSRGRTRR